MDIRNEIPVWGWCMGQLLQKLDREMQANPERSIGDLLSEFKKEHWVEAAGFNIMNQGTTLMLMYALLVVPREIWERERSNFSFTTRDKFSTTVGEEASTEAFDFLRLLRNSLSHANYSINLKDQSFTFWNEHKGKKTFETTVGYSDLGGFITEVAKYYINDVRNRERNNA